MLIKFYFLILYPIHFLQLFKPTTQPLGAFLKMQSFVINFSSSSHGNSSSFMILLTSRSFNLLTLLQMHQNYSMLQWPNVFLGKAKLQHTFKISLTIPGKLNFLALQITPTIRIFLKVLSQRLLIKH